MKRIELFPTAVALAILAVLSPGTLAEQMELQSVSNNPPKQSGENIGGTGLSGAVLPAGPNQVGQVDLTLLGSGLAGGMYVTVDGGAGVTPGEKDNLQILDSKRAYAVVTLTGPLSLNATYRVHLFDSAGNALNTVSLDLEYLVQYKAGSDLASTEANAGGDSQQQARKRKREAKKIERQTAANEQLISAKKKAEAAQREMYLVDHPDIQAQAENPFSVPSPDDGAAPTSDSYCKYDSTAESTYIRVRRSVIDPKEASDSYGRRLGRRFIVFEVTVENDSPSLQYILHDVSVDLSRLHHLPLGTDQWAFSSQDLIMLRGVPEKGADYDPRNLILHSMQGTGAVAGGVTGLTSVAIQDLYGGVTAAFNGPVLSAFGGIFPDHTATQLNRLSDSAFTANTVVAKQSAKTFAIFVPEGLFMTREEQDEYWNEPISVLGGGLDFRKADVCVDGAFISEVPAITLTSVKYDDPTKATAGASVAIDLAGTNFSSSDTLVDLSIGGSPQNPVPVSSASADGKTASASISLPAGWTAQIAVTVGVESKSTGIKAPPLPLALPAVSGLTLSAAALDDPTKAGANAQVVVDLTGQGMVAGDTQLVFNNGTQNPYDVTGITDGTTGKATVTLPSDYNASTSYSCLLKSKKSGTSSKAVNLKTSH